MEPMSFTLGSVLFHASELLGSPTCSTVFFQSSVHCKCNFTRNSPNLGGNLDTEAWSMAKASTTALPGAKGNRNASKS